MTTSARSANARALPSDRRRFLAVAGAASLAGFARASAALAGTGDPDAALLALRPEWLRRRAAHEAALTTKGSVDAEIYRRSGRYPDPNSFPGSAEEPGVAYRAVADQRLAAHIELGAAETDRLEADASAAETAIVEEIEGIEARGWGGVLFKLEVSKEWDDQREELTASLLADVRTLATKEIADA